METMTFKSAKFGGFDRQDVLDSFEEANQRYTEEKQALLGQMNKLKEQQEEMQAEYTKYKQGENHKNELIDKLQLLVKKQHADNEKLKKINLALEKHAGEIRAQNQQLQENQSSSDQNSSDVAKRLQVFEESGYSAERILSEANARSASTLADANKRASAILTEAAKKASDSMDEANRQSKSILREAEQQAKEIKYAAQKYSQQAKNRLEQLALELSERKKRIAIKSAEAVRDGRIQAAEIVKEAKGKLDQANQQRARFERDLVNLKLSMQAVLQQIESKVELIDHNMPQKLDTDWLGESLIPVDEFDKDELFRRALQQESLLSHGEQETSLSFETEEMSELDKILHENNIDLNFDEDSYDKTDPFVNLDAKES